MKFINNLLAMAMVATMVSCASVSAPEGGAKDVAPPNLVSSNPQHQTLNVSTKTISLEFDEEVQPNNLSKELLITPNIEGKYAVVSKRNKLDLVFEQPLEDSTTYTFNFRKGIVDITEKNQAQDLILIFSTGSYIDSSSVSGNVVDLLRQTPEKEAVVALYPTSDTLSIRKNRPYYQASTDEAGNFRFENVREGEYRIFALMDKNNNAFYDNENEKIAYLNQPIRVTPDSQFVKLQTARIDTRRPILSRRDKFTDRFVANYNEGISAFSARPLENAQDTIIYKIASEDGKAVELYGGNGFTGGRAILAAIDSSGNVANDTIAIAFEGKRAQRVRGAALKSIPGRTSNRVGQPVTIEFETPVTVTAGEPIKLMADSVILKSFKFSEELTLDRTTTEMTFNIPSVTVNRNMQFSLVLDSTAILPVQGERLRLPNLPITIAEAKAAGSLKGTIETAYPSYFVQLLTDKFQLRQELRSNNAKNFEFRNLEPGSYIIRVLIDENNNGKWESADPDLLREPEKVYVHPKAFEVRSNWEMTDERLIF